MKTFEKIGSTIGYSCPICNKYDDCDHENKEVVLIPIYGAQQDSIAEAIPVQLVVLSRVYGNIY